MAKIGLVLSGGGTRGLAHIGALKELEKLGFKFNAIAGCSMGSIIGAFYAAGKSAAEIESYFLEHKLFDVIDLSLSKLGIKRTKKLQEFVEDFIGVKTFEELKTPLYINATNLTIGKEVIYSSGSIFEAIRASISIPGIFAPKVVDGEYLVDGGVVNQSPFSILPKSIKRYVLINVMAYEAQLRKVSIRSLLEASLSAMQEEILNLRLSKVSSKNYVLIEPDLKGHLILEDRKHFSEIILKGVKAVESRKLKLKRLKRKFLYRK